MPLTFNPARLLALKEESGLAYRAIAELAGLDHKQVERYCKGVTTPQADTLAAILGAMGRTWADLDEPRRARRRKS